MSDETGRHRAQRQQQPADPQAPAPSQPWHAPGYGDERPTYQPYPQSSPADAPRQDQPSQQPYQLDSAYPAPYPPPPGPGAPFAPYPAAAPAWPGGTQQVWSPEPPAPRRRNRRRMIAAIAGGLVVLAVVGAIVGGLVAGSGNAKPAVHVSLPAAFSGYTQLHNAMSDRVENAIRDFAKNAGIGGAFDADATIGSYSHNTGDQPVLVTLVLPISAAGGTSGESPEHVVAEMMMGTGADTQHFAPGRHGGSAECGQATFGVAKETLCAWADTRLAGVIYSINEGKTPAAMATLTRQFRDRIE